MSVTVVVPTYNRAHLLPSTIPSYLQDDVERLILVDDCSSDETPEVMRMLESKYPGKITCLRNETNRKQTYSKNRGKALAETAYIYFGDDDSILVPGSIKALLDAQKETNAGIVGAVALYCKHGTSVEQRYTQYLLEQEVEDAERFVDLKRLRFKFDQKPQRTILLPVVHAAILVRRDLYTKIDFDLDFKGNCYREETDYILRATELGYTVCATANAAQINYPPEIASGGSRSLGRLSYEYYSLTNTWRFLKKHKHYFNKIVGVSILFPLAWYVIDRAMAAAKKVTG